MEDANLDEIKKSIAKINKLKRQKQKKDRFCRMYTKLNRSYKNLPWYKDRFMYDELKEVFQNTALPVFRKMRNYGWVKCQHYEGDSIHDKGYYLKSNIENLFLLQELMCQMDDDYWGFDKNHKRHKVEYIPFYFDSVYLGKIKICSYPKTLEWKAEQLTKFLHSKEFLFDEESSFYKGYKKTIYFITNNLMWGKVEKWDFYLKRFLAENN